MKFNSGENSIVDDARYWSRTNSTTYPIADIVRNANAGLDRVTALIMRFDNTWEWDDDNQTDLPIATTALVSGQSDYALAISHLKILRIRVKDQNGGWQTLNPVSRRELSDSQLAETGTPRCYDKLGNSILLTPTPDYAQAASLEIQFQRTASYFATTGTDTTVPGFAAQFHRLLSLYIALDYRDLSEKQAKKIRERIGNPPDPDRNIVGTGLEGELCDFYASRDYDRPHSLQLQHEDYGQSAMTDGTAGSHPTRFYF